MKSQQIHKYAALITKYQNRKKSSRLTTSLHHNAQMSPFSQTMDADIFKQAIQQKIKSKYKEPKTIKTSTEPSANYLHLDTISKIQQQTHKDEYSDVEEDEKSKLIKQKVYSILKVNNLAMNKRNPSIFTNTSNLLSLASPSFVKNRRQLQESNGSSYDRIQNQVSIFRQEHIKKTMKQQFDKNQKMLKYGYELDGSIFHFQNPNIKTTPSQLQYNRRETIKSQKKQKQRIYQALKSTSPLIVTPKMLKSNLEKAKAFTKNQMLATPHKYLKKKTYVKSSSERIQNQQAYNQFKMNSLHIRKSPKLFTSKKPEAVLSGWDYEQQL